MNVLTTLPSLREVFADVFRNLKLLIIVFLIPPVIASALALMLDPVYQADAKILIKSGREFMPTTNIGLNDQGAPISSMAEVVKSETEILNSQDLAENVLQKLTIPAVFPDLVADTDTDIPAIDQAIDLFSKQLAVDPVELSNVVDVSFNSKDPQMAIKVLNALLGDFQARHVTLYSSMLSKPIEEQIDAKQKLLQAVDAKRVEFQNANGAFSVPDQRASLIQQRAQITALLQDAEIRSGALAEQVAFLKKNRAGTPQEAPLDSEIDPAAGASGAALDQLMALRQKEQELLQHYQPGAPAVTQIRQQIAQAEQFVKQAQSGNNKKVRTGANPLIAAIDQQLLTSQSELTPINSQIAGYKEQAAAIDEQLRTLQDSELQVNTLQRQIDSLTLDIQTLRTNLEQARFSENMDLAKVSSISIIDAPRLEPKPIFPKKILFGLAGVAVGLTFASLVVLSSLAFGNTIITVEAAERILGTPVVAALPRVSALPAA